MRRRNGKHTNDKRPASLSRRGAELFHRGGYLKGLCELAVFLKEALEFGLDISHACDFVRIKMVRQGKGLDNEKKLEDATLERDL